MRASTNRNKCAICIWDFFLKKKRARELLFGRLGILGRLVVEVVGAEQLAAVGERLLAEEGDGVGVADAALLDAVVAGERDAAAVAGVVDLGAVRLGALEQAHVADLVLVVAADLHPVPAAGARRRLRLVVDLLRLEVAALHLHRRAWHALFCVVFCFVTDDA
jgi:hypothetical protein|uniref:Uncharacterized protein n=1 Tax=Zea mays TaxID=4577 RepID=C4JBN4_MAIZE|nr:unknown [Zea mays]